MTNDQHPDAELTVVCIHADGTQHGTDLAFDDQDATLRPVDAADLRFGMVLVGGNGGRSRVTDTPSVPRDGSDFVVKTEHGNLLVSPNDTFDVAT